MPKRASDNGEESNLKYPAPAKPKKKVSLDETAMLEGAPREGTQARLFWEYGQAFARGMSRGANAPFTAPAVKGPQDVLVRLMRAHGRAEDGSMLKGSDVRQWLEDVAFEFRSRADPIGFVRFNKGWTAEGLARWLDAGRPVTVSARQASGSHIAIDRR